MNGLNDVLRRLREEAGLASEDSPRCEGSDPVMMGGVPSYGYEPCRRTAAYIATSKSDGVQTRYCEKHATRLREDSRFEISALRTGG
jgi:hypothetical protein